MTGKSVAIMQPYIFPYIGYFQLISCVDEFVIYDNIQFTKQSWINRNRILVNGADAFISFPVRKDSDYLDVNMRALSDSWEAKRNTLLNKISGNYRKAPYYEHAMALIEEIILFENKNLFEFVHNSIREISAYLQIKTPIIRSSTIPIDHDLKSVDKVIAICKMLNAKKYINPIGGVELYDKSVFKRNGLDLSFLKTGAVVYRQFDNEFVPFLSIIDVLMFNSQADIMRHLKNYSLL